jgi:hypothetical protein
VPSILADRSLARRILSPIDLADVGDLSYESLGRSRS